MSISTEITRINTAKADIISALSEKGVTVADGASISDMGDYIRSIEVGGEMDFNTIYPVGSIYMSVNSTSPATLFGGTWEQIKDTFLLSAGDTYSAGATGGEAEHTTTIDEMPMHNHSHDDAYKNYWVLLYTEGSTRSRFAAGTSGGYAGQNDIQSNLKWSDFSTGNCGGGQPHNNMPPYLVVYMWKRTA